MVTVSPLAGLPLHYLIAVDGRLGGRDGVMTEVGYDGQLPMRGVGIGYANLYDQEGNAAYPPYLKPTDTASAYRERVLDWRGEGWTKLLNAQFHKLWTNGFKYIELDNPDGYPMSAVLDSCDRAVSVGFKLMAKNPLQVQVPARYLSHPGVAAAIIEADEDTQPGDLLMQMDRLRASVSRPELPLRFVTFGRHYDYGVQIAKDARSLHDVGVTYSHGEYDETIELLAPEVD